MATAKGGGEAVLERSVSPGSNQQKGLDFNLDYHGNAIGNPLLRPKIQEGD